MSQKWHPDTCPGFLTNQGCAIEVPNSGVDPGPVLSVVQKCSAHQHLDGEALRVALLAENRLKNQAFGEAGAALGLNMSDEADVRAALNRIQWAYDSNRKLSLSLAAASLVERSAVQAALDVRFGPGVVTVV